MSNPRIVIFGSGAKQDKTFTVKSVPAPSKGASTEFESRILEQLESTGELVEVHGRKGHVRGPQTELISHKMLTGKMRDFVINVIKKPLQAAIEKAGFLLPTPNLRNTAFHNTHILLRIMDEFFENEDNAGREKMFRAGWKILITEYEHDPYYRHRFDWLLEQLTEAVNSGEWKPRPQGRPLPQWWRETRREK